MVPRIIRGRHRTLFGMGNFSGARLKIEWANHHIARLTSRIKLFHESCTSSVEINPELGNEVIKHDIPCGDARRDIALIAGDAFHNLKCALDYAWIETITKLAPNALGKFAKFPVYPTYDDLEAALRGNGIDRASDELFRVMLSDIEPYAGGNVAVWSVHRLNIRDKHRLLIPVFFYSSIRGIETEDETGISKNGFTFGTHQEPPWYVPMPAGTHVKKNGKLSFSVMFKYGKAEDEAAHAEEIPVYSRLFLNVVETLEAFV